jgi:hypothetical protein
MKPRSLIVKDSILRPAYIVSIMGAFCLIAWLGLVAPPPVLAVGLSGTIASDSTWSGTVDVAGDIVVQSGATLTVEPGTEVRFTANMSTSDDPLGTNGLCDVIILSALVASGGPDPTDSIVFRSDSLPGAPGEWGSIAFMDVQGRPA